jgi:hypothetical protein
MHRTNSRRFMIAPRNCRGHRNGNDSAPEEPVPAPSWKIGVETQAAHV